MTKAMDWLVYPVRDLSGGTNLLSNDFLHGQDELGLIVNWDLNKLGSIQKIFGYSSYGERVHDAINVLGIGNYYYSGGQAQLLGIDFGSGAVSPSSSASPSLSPSSSASSSESPSPTPSSSASPSNSPSFSPSASTSPSSSASPSNSPSDSPSQSESPSNSPSLSPSTSQSPSVSPSLSPSSSASPSFAYSTAEIFVFNPADNTWTDQNQELTSGSKIEFCTYLDGVFAVNFSDATRYYNGTSWSTSTNVTSAPKAKYVISFNDRLYLAYLDISATTYSCRVLASSLPDDSYNITWDTSSSGPFFDVSPLDGDVITGLSRNFNRLLVFKENSLWKYDGSTLSQFPGAPGTNNSRSIQNIREYTLYFNPSGVYGLVYSSSDSGDSVKLLSRAIQPIIDGVQSVNLDRICSYTKGDHYYLFLHDVINEEEGINITNCLVDLDVSRMRWSVRSLSKTPTVFGTYRNSRTEITYNDTDTEYDYANQAYDGYTSAQDFIYFGDDTGRVYQIDTSYDFDGDVINSYFETTNYYIAGIQAKAELQAVKIYTDKGRRCKFYYSVDDGPWKPIIRYEYRNGEIYYTFESGQIINHIKLKCTDNSTGDRSAIKGFDYVYTPSYEI
jgi:hypothetical protein